MAITTTNGKLAIMELDQDYEPGLPISPGAFGQDDKQQLLWGFPEILWVDASANVPVVPVFAAPRPVAVPVVGRSRNSAIRVGTIGISVRRRGSHGN